MIFYGFLLAGPRKFILGVSYVISGEPSLFTPNKFYPDDRGLAKSSLVVVLI